ncbi:hypothetical protein LMG19144_02846 [Xanthomonas arboricola pv. fragariae]|nr:hypothetical protein [Xanthomonas arboricola]SOU07782.1 hypothetical protein LMG19144_02846 [Xanthomonas arboricola pv. fragariae]
MGNRKSEAAIRPALIPHSRFPILLTPPYGFIGRIRLHSPPYVDDTTA